MGKTAVGGRPGPLLLRRRREGKEGEAAARMHSFLCCRPDAAKSILTPGAQFLTYSPRASDGPIPSDALMHNR